MNYTKLNNTYFATPKDDWKDRIQIEIGDSKEQDFYPQLKVMRWDNECNVSLRLKTDLTAVPSKTGEKISWDTDKVSADIYPITEGEGGHEFEIILKEKPVSNVIEFTLQDKDVEYFYQPELTQEEKDKGAKRPENVVGSYAVYASENKINYVGGKEYKVGKVGHIFRPKIVDAKGTEVWGELLIENGILSVTIPQDFLDKAVYPIRHAAGLEFGYKTLGNSTTSMNSSLLVGSLFSAPSDYSTFTSLTLGFDNQIPPSDNAKGVIVLHSNLNIVSNGVSNAVSVPGLTKDWVTPDFSSTPSISASTDYVLAIVTGSSYAYTIYDSGAENQGHTDVTNNYTTPENPTGAEHSTNKYSIYCTYSAGVSSAIKTINGLAKASVKTVDGLAAASVKTWNGLE